MRDNELPNEDEITLMMDEWNHYLTVSEKRLRPLPDFNDSLNELDDLLALLDSAETPDLTSGIKRYF